MNKFPIDGDLYDCMLIIAEEEGGVLPFMDFVSQDGAPGCVYGMAIAALGPTAPTLPLGAGAPGRGASDEAIVREQKARGLQEVQRVPLPAVLERLGIVRGPEGEGL